MRAPDRKFIFVLCMEAFDCLLHRISCFSTPKLYFFPLPLIRSGKTEDVEEDFAVQGYPTLTNPCMLASHARTCCMQ